MPHKNKTFDSLARDASAEGRGRLLVDLTELVLTDPPATDGERAIFFDIVRVILPAAADEYRRLFSETAADRDGVPRDLLMTLGRDVIEIAAPVLTRSRGFEDPDLVVLAADQTDGHRLAIAGRTIVAGCVTEVLVRNGSRDVLRRLGANTGAVFTATAVADVRRRAEGDDDLFAVFADRNDLADLLAGSMRETLARLAAAKPRRRAKPVVEEPPPRKPKPENAGVAALLALVKSGDLTLEEAVTDLASADRHADLARFLGDVSGIDETQILRVLVRADANGIATVVRGLELSEATWDKVVDMRKRKLKFSPTQAKWEREHFSRMDVAEAKVTLSAFTDRRRAG